MNNSLENIKRSIKYLAKRYKGISYSTGLVLLFAMLGVNAFSEEIIEEVAVANSTNIIEKSEIKTSADRLSEVLRQIKEENEKKLNGANLELIQLMEQGDQVVKSPWASWQFGINYFYSDDTGRYKGRGDKSRRYPYEGIFVRSDSIFERYTSPDSSNYSKLKSSNNLTPGNPGNPSDPNNSGDPKLKSLSASKMATTSLRKGLGSKEISEVDYGITSIKRTREPITSFEVAASINPRTIEKSIKEPNIPPSTTFELPEISVASPAAPTVESNIPVVNVGTVHSKTVNPPVLPKAVDFNLPEINVTSPAAPTVESNIPTVNVGTVQPKTVNPPVLPKAITFELPEINVDTPVAPTVTSNPPVINVGAVHPKTVTPPVLPKAITFNLPVVNVNAPTAPTVTSNPPVINVGTVQGKTIEPPEPPKTIDFSLPKIKISKITQPTITPNEPTVTPPEVQPKTVTPPVLPKAISFSPAEPTIVIPETPSLPEPPTFKVIVGADCNSGDGTSCATGSHILKGTAGTDGYEFLQYTWQNSNERQGLAFKWFDAVTNSSNYFYGGGSSAVIDGVNYNGINRTTGNTISVNSYNDLTGYVYPSTNTTPKDRNKQYFLVGGSRAIESDQYYGNGGIYNLGTVNLRGILTLGMVSQTSQNSNNVINNGTITDEDEKDQAYIQNVVSKYDTDTDGDSIADALRIYGSNDEVYDIKLKNGYVGYKIGMAVVPENTSSDRTNLLNTGNIKFHGNNSIGMYVYFPTTLKATDTTFFGNLKNKGIITLTGRESHGMKLAGKAGVGATYENAGTINLENSADVSTGMALMADSTVKDVSLAKGVAKNTGTINLKDVKNSSGMFINIDSNMTNTGKIVINSTITANADPQKQEYNIGMRADSAALTSSPATYTSPEIINDTDGNIMLNGSYAIGMSVKGSQTKDAIAINKGKITTSDNDGTTSDDTVKNGIGIFNLDGKITNEGTIKLTGTGDDVNNIGIFLKEDKSNASGILKSGSDITVQGNGSTGILLGKGTSLKYDGNLTVQGDKVLGIVVTKDSTVTQENTAGGKITVNKDTLPAGGDSAKGSYGLVVQQGGSLELDKTEADINVTGEKSVGVYSEGKLELGKTNVTTSDGAVNFFAKDNGTISIKGGTSETGQKSLLFFQKTSNATDNPKILIKDNMTATIKGGTDSSNRGTAFFYEGSGSGYSSFSSTAIETWRDKIFKDTATNTNTLNKLTLNMENGSRLFVASKVEMNLTNTNPGALKNSLGLKAITGTDYKTFMLYNSKLTMDKDVDLNDANDDYRKLEISNSSIINEKKISGSQINQVGIAQENNLPNKDAVTITNKGSIELTGDKSTAIYAKFGKIENAATGKITTKGTQSAGIYALNNTEATNKGTITVGENSTGMFYSDVETGKTHATSTGLKNEKEIILSGKDAVGMYYEPGDIGANTVKFENTATGEIKATVNSTVGMYAKKSKDSKLYEAINAGKITLKDGTKANPTIAMYTDATTAGTNKLINIGTITVGNNGIGMYGYDEETLGNITVGNTGIALYTQGGTVSVGAASTLKVGNSDAVGIYTKGTSGTITSNGKYEIGNDSYGIIDVGTGNTVNVSGTAKLLNRGKFIYSEDTTGKVTTAADITATGNENYGIYSSGKVTNTGTIDLAAGTGNIGILVKSATGNVENSGNIKIGASTTTNRGIGIVANGGTAKNTGTTGKIEVDGDNGLGLYAVNGGTIENAAGGKVITKGASTVGVYAADTSNIKLTGGEVNVTGTSTIGYYLDKGTKSTVDSSAKINVTGNESTGLFVNEGKITTYSGTTTVKGDGVYGAVVDKGTITATGGTITVEGASGASNQTANRGTVGLVVQTGGTVAGNTLDVVAKVKGEKSVGVYSAGTANIGAANITTSDGAVNFFAENGTISINEASTVVTGTGTNRGSLLFYAPSATSQILINATMNATVKGDADASKTGTAFFYEGQGAGYSPFTATDITKWRTQRFGSTLSNLTLNMENNSRLFTASKVKMNLSDTGGTALKGALGSVTISGTNYKTFMLYNSELTVDKDVTLNNPNDDYRKLEISNSSIINEKKISGTLANQVAIGQVNNLSNKDAVTLTNKGSIELGGEKSTAIYAKNGIIENAATTGKISLTGKNSTGIFALKNTEVTNKGEISVGGKGSTGIFYSDIESKTTVYDTTTGLKNEGKIALVEQDTVGMYYEPGKIGTANVTFENAVGGKIEATKDNTVGMYAKVSKDSKKYDTINAGTITLKNGTTASPTIAMYTDATTKGINPLKNTGTITVGNSGIGMYGYDETTSGNITVGDKGIALYTQGGTVDVKNTSTLTVGKSDAVGIYAKGTKGTITSAGKYVIGDESYGIVDKGTGNNITVTGGTATLSNKGKFIYSEDTTGTITNAATVTSTGDENYGIYSSGKVTNTGTIDLTTGTGNIGILAKSTTGNAENKGTIKVGASTATKRSIGIVANDNGKAKNTGTVEVTKADGLGLYAANGGTVENAANGKVITNGNSTIGAYAAGNSNINLTGGEIKVSGKSATGYYLDGGTNSTIAAAAKVNVTGDESTGLFVNTGKLKYSGETTVKGKGVYGAAVRPNGTIEATGGTLTVEGDQTTTRGTIGLVVQNAGKITGKGLDVVAKVSGEKSVGVYSAGNAEIGKANITTSNGAINFFAENGTISINEQSTVVTGTGTNSGSLLFYAPSATSKILINAPMTATVKGDADASKTGTAFFYQGQTTPGYTPLTATDTTTWKTARFNNTLSKLTLNMENNSRLFTASKVKMNLTDTSGTGLKNALGLAALTGTGYKTFMLYNSHLTINKDVNLNSASDDYRRLEISNSSIVNNKKISGTQANQVAIAQENNLTDKNAVIITNNGSIELSGNKSTAIYAKNGKVINAANGTIAVGKQSSGIYALNNTEVTNKGKINAGEGSTGIFYSDVETKTTHATKTGLKNEGTITLTGPDSVGMYFEPGNIGTANVTFENAATGKITATKDSTEGMYAKVSKDGKSYNTINAGTIALRNGTTANPTIAMYTDATTKGTNPLKNIGTITVGNSGIGMYGFEEETSGNITVGDKGIALYTKGGKVDVTASSTLKVGNNDAVGIYATGNNSTITSAGKYEIGNDSYGIIDKGTGNTVNVTGTAKLSNRGKFIYSADTTGTVTNAATITATGGENYGIYSNGTVKNTGTMNLATGTGNIGILVKSATGNAENTGTIKVGASTTAKRSIGIVANDNAKAKNTGTVEVTGDNGLGLYAVNGGTIENATGGTITTTGDSTIGAYAADKSNINLTGGEVKVTGKSAIGYYLDKGQSSKIAAPAKVTVTGDKTTGLFVNAGKLTYTGATTVTGNGVYGAVVGANGEIAATSGTINVAGTSGASNQTTNRGTVGLVVQTNGKVTGNGLDVTAKVAGGKSVGIYSAGNASIGAANVTTSNGAVNFFADSGTISINKASTVETGTGADRGSLLFYAPTNTSKILINAPMTATVKGHTDASRTGTAFFYQGSGPGYSSFTAADITAWKTARFENKLSNLTLNMENNSRLFTASKVAMNLSNTSGTALAGALGTNIVGSNYKTFMLYNSQLTIDKNVNLDNPNDDYRRLEISNSSIINNKQMTGTQANQVAIAQENNLSNKDAVTITNNGSIELTGVNSTAIYTKNGKIVNAAAGKISTTGTQSAGIYALNNTEISNKGAISVGKDSTGIFYSDVETKVTHNTTTGLKNEGTITLAGPDAVGMYYEPGKIGANIVRFENAGKIIATSDSTEGMYAKVSKDKKSYDTVNTGTITLKNGTTANPTIAMYTDATTKGTNPLKNEGTITVGNNGIGMYGFEESTSGNITVGDAGIALYTQGGAVNVASTSTLKVGKSDATGIYATGNNGTITSAGNYEIGKESYGIINVGKGNTINVTSGTAKLTEKGKFIYSSDEKGTIKNAANVTSTGGENYGIYATGKVTNTGNINLAAGTGNIGILIKNGGTAENSGNIKVGASTTTDRSIGIVANNGGKAKNTGAVEVAGANGLGLYAVNGGTVENATGGTITTTGDSTVGAYAADTANINLTGGEVKVTGKSTIGYYLDKGTNSKVTSNAKINVTGNESTGLFVSTGKLAYNGTTTVKGDGVYGAVVDKGTITATSGTVNVEGNQTANRGTVGLVVQTGGKVTGNGLDVIAKVTGEKSVGVYSAGNASIGKANITTSNGAVNFFAEDGTISINKASTVETGTGADRGSLLFYAPSATSKILINAPMTATVKGHTDASRTGTAFFYQGQTTPGYSSFTASDIGTWKTSRFGSTLSNLTLNMQDNSRLFTASKVAMKLSDTSGTALSGALGANIVGSNYKTFMLYNSQLIIDKDVNLDNANDDYRKLEISNSSIINNKKIKGTQANQVAIAQENALADKNVVTITNNGSIELTGANSTAIYTKNGKVINAAGGTITTTGAQSAGIYALNNTEVSNKGKISVGKDSTGMFYSDITDKGATVYNTKTGLKNEGTITLAGQDAVGMYYEPGKIGTNIVRFENAGKIIATSDSTEGMYAKVSKDGKSYDTVNAGTIALKNGTTTNPTIAMYTDATTKGTNPLKNIGTITVGNSGIGMYGYDETTSGNITVGDKGIALYTQGGTVNVANSSTLKVGNSDAVGIYATGNNGTITSAGNYEIGNDSYGIIDVGAGNTINVSGTAKLSNRGKFIYSKDTTGTVENAATITSTGGENYGIYSSGKVKNTGNINLATGIGNIGLLIKNGGTAENSGTIKAGASTATERSIGIVANNSGKAKNTGAVEVAGANGLGLYAVNGGTIENTTGGTITTTGDSTIGAYAADKSNINLTGGEVKVTGKSTIGYYLDKGTNSKVTPNAKINVTGDESTGLFVSAGKLAYNGTTTVKGNGVYGAVVDKGTIEATSGTITVEGNSGASNQTKDRGTVGLVVQTGGTITGNGLDVVAKVTGEKSVGVYSAGNASIGAANIVASNGAVNFFAEDGTISINKASTVETGTGTNRGSLLFYAPTNTSKILINAPMTATVKGHTEASKTGTAFFYQGQGAGYSSFTASDIGTWKTARFGSTLSNLALNMQDNSRLFTASKVAMNLSDTSGAGIKTALGLGALTGSNYKTFMLYNSKLTIDKDVNLDNANDDYRRLEISNSSIINNKKIKGTQANQVAIAQENILPDKNAVTITNNGSIELTGPNSTAIYAKNGIIENAAGASITTTGKESIGIFHSDTGSAVSLKNRGNITVGDAGTAIYSKGGSIDLAGGKITTGAEEAVGVFTVGTKQNISNTGTTFDLKNNSFGFVNTGKENTITTASTTTAKLGKDSVYIYSDDVKGKVENGTNLTSTGDRNYGIYAAGTVTNTGNINFATGTGNVGIYTIKGGNAINRGIISIGASDVENESYGIGMAIGGDKNSNGGSITNKGTILVQDEHSIGMYGSGKGVKVKNDSKITLNANSTTGIYLDNGAEGINTGVIETGKAGLSKVVGVYLGQNTTLNNQGSIRINATDGVGIYLKGGMVKNYGTINVTGTDSKDTYQYKPADTSKGLDDVKIDTKPETPIITRKGVKVSPFIAKKIEVDPKNPEIPSIDGKSIEGMNIKDLPKYKKDELVSKDSIGMYIDTSGINTTNPIEGLERLTNKADLIVGTEASKYTTNKDIIIKDPKIIKPYREAMLKNKKVTNWNIYSGSLTWTATASLDKNGYIDSNIVMSKIPYTAWAGDKALPVAPSDVYNFTNGLEQRYGVDGLGTKENKLFQKLNSIGKNEEILLHQAFDEMMGHQYGNLQQRIQATGSVLDKEFNYLRREWRTASKDSNKLKVFGMNGEYSTDTAGIIDYKSKAYGVAYVGENETFRLGDTTGWYTGIVHNTNKFKDIGNSKEEMLQAKLGIFKSEAFDENNSLNWTISGEGFVGYNKMDRKYLVVNETFGAKAKYWTYGVAVKNELSKDFRLTEDFNFRVYGSMKAEYGRFEKIKEKNGQVKLEIKANDYYSIKPELGAEIGYKQPMGLSMLNARVGIAYENELGKVANAKNKARVAHTNADWFNVRGEKEDRRGNIKLDFNVGYDNSRYGVTANVGYDTKGENIRGGLGLRVIF